MSQPYPVTGASGSGAVYPRLEIRNLVQKPEQFSLFIQAWLNIRNPTGGVPLPAQHVQIGGIHGLPHTKWPGDPNGIGGSNAEWQGYCNHQSVLFPTWHRPYVMLLEQSIWNEAQNILKKSNVKPETAAKWQQAAKELRFPFWDWTLPITGKEGLPRIFYEPKLTLQMPDGTTSSVENILAYYNFGNQGLPAGFRDVEREIKDVAPGIHTSYFSIWTRTYRWPNSATTNVIENYAKLNETLTSTNSSKRGSYPEFMGKVAQMFSYPPKDSRSSIIWDQFSNTRGQSTATHNFRLASLEESHNTLHLVIGGSGGNMMDNDYAGFDPIFFMHHCNVDRLLAFWEHVYPSYWMGRDGFPTPSGNQPFTQIRGTWSEPNHAVINELSGLTPYRKPDGKYWNGNDTRFVGSMGFPKYYTYPPINGVSLDKPASDRDLKLLQDYFGQRPTAHRNNQIRIKQPLFSNDSVEALPHDNEPVYNFRQFAILVELVEHAFGGSHFLEVLYTSKDGQTYGVGATAVLSRSHDTQCPGCIGRRHENIKLHDSIHIPHDVIVKIITDHDLNHENIGDEEFTKAISGNLHAQIVTPGGLVLARAVYGQRRNQPDLTAVDEAIVPKLQFASANVCADKHRQGDEEIHPWQFYDWKDHGAILENEWVNASE